MTHVAIIGGGIAGLATAFYLQKRSRDRGQPLDYTLIESDSRFGGKIVTTSVEGFVIEGGPDSFVTMKPHGLQLCHDLNLDEEIIPTNDHLRDIFVLKNGRLIGFPGGLRLTIPTEFVPFATSPLISPLGKIRMGLDLVIPPRRETGDESLASFIRRRLGHEALDKIAGPMMAGIYVADPEKLSIESTFPQFVEMERQHGSLIKAMQQAKKKSPLRPNNGQPQAMFNSLKPGMTRLVEALVRQLEGELCLGQRVVAIKRLPDGFEIKLDRPASEVITAEAVVLAIPAYTAADLVAPFMPELSRLLRQVRYLSTATVSLGYRRSQVKGRPNFQGFGFMIPKSEQRRILACTWSSNKFNGRAAADHVLLRAFVGGDEHGHLVETLSDDALRQVAQSEIAEIMGIRAEPAVHQIFRWIKGNPQYDVGHLDRVAQMEALAGQIPGLYLAGSAFRGIGIPDCVKSALATVDQIMHQFGRTTTI
jgi:oxygen-dependent protoporphyrinogen oxidase